MNDPHDLKAGLEVLETMRKRVSGIKSRADVGLAALRDELGANCDVDAVAEACAEYHLALVLLLDTLTSSGLKRGNWKPR